MSEKNNPPKMTSVKKEEDPKRMIAGNRLAKISKHAKEKKCAIRLNQRDKTTMLNGILITIIYSV